MCKRFPEAGARQSKASSNKDAVDTRVYEERLVQTGSNRRKVESSRPQHQAAHSRERRELLSRMIVLWSDSYGEQSEMMPQVRRILKLLLMTGAQRL